MWIVLSEYNLIRLLLLKYKNKYISAMILLMLNGTAIDEYTVTCRDYRDLHPDHFIIWQAIKLAKEEGCKIFDFGRTSVANAGLLKFKDSWGTIRKPLCYVYYPCIKTISNESRNSFKVKILKNTVQYMPSKVFQWCGNIVYYLMQ